MSESSQPDAQAQNISLEDRVAVVTGASRGLGRAMALALAEAGARVVLASPHDGLLREVGDEISGRFGKGRVLVTATDIRVQSQCERLIERTVSAFGALDILVNNARRPHRGPGLPASGNCLPFWESNAEIWRETVDVNVNGAFLISRAAAPHMIKQGWGRIIVLTTSLDTMQSANNSPYGVTKAALEAATLIWAKDLDGTGVTVNSLLPGGACDSDPERPPRAGQRLLPVDIMNPVLIWLASPLSDGKTGGRYVGSLWNTALPFDQAAAGALEEQVLRTPPARRRR